MEPHIYFNVGCVVVAREYELNVAFDDEVHLNDFLSFLINVLLLLYLHLSDGSAHPYDEGILLLIEEFNVEKFLLIYLHGQLQLKLVREFVHELDGVLGFLAVVVAKGLD